jgi:hypothetical protein
LSQLLELVGGQDQDVAAIAHAGAHGVLKVGAPVPPGAGDDRQVDVAEAIVPARA